MPDQKIENMLNLALNATEEERARSLDLNVGFNKEDQVWDLIVRYHGDILHLETPQIQIAELYAGYAIVTIPERMISEFALQPEIEYIEKPKRLFFSVNQGKTASCINPLQSGEKMLNGKGILVAVIDSGVDYFHPDFRNEDGSSRILKLWDQSIPGNPPEGYIRGTEYTKDKIEEATWDGSAWNRGGKWESIGWGEPWPCVQKRFSGREDGKCTAKFISTHNGTDRRD